QRTMIAMQKSLLIVVIALFSMYSCSRPSLTVPVLNHIPEQYLGQSLAQMKLKAETGILVMLVESKGKKPEAAGADTVFQVGDKLTVFGNYKTICRTFDAQESFEDQ
ncbi:MAG: TrkA C-terminal domain-containing protein, partial [Lachnospiraceae bacterium]|nr:TrkA C-terminal domain-containing protein [Lachnospiraceae bacterium]